MNDPNPAPRELRATAPPGPRRGHLPFGEPEGAPDRIEVTSRRIERAGRPWFPITGEIHYSRTPRERWNEILGHARAGGLDSVATYVFWRAHEPEPGRFDWTGDLDLRAFTELAAAHGLDVVVRLGPWAHGEARYGGFPDWLMERDLKTRTDDPDYLALVRPLYAETIAQLKGLTHAEGGPVVAAQVDNELYDQPGHLATLRALAEELGLRVPIWTATGWGGAQVPDTLLPVYSAYSEGFWEDETTEWAAFAPFHYRYSEVRDDLTVGADLREALDGVTAAPAGVAAGDPATPFATCDPATPFATCDPATPFATCELGGGMHVAYHRRPLVSGEDVAALALAKIGSGSAWQGYYMYAGGTQRTGPQGPEQESQDTGYPNDVPALSYDFHAPIGEHGQIRPHHHYLRRQHLWLREDGHRIAAMAAEVGGGSEDPEELRWAVRSDGTSGYLFLTTYQPPKRPLAPQRGVQFTVHFDETSVTVPSAPVDVPAGHSLAWPLRYPLTPDLTLRSATAQLLTRIATGGGTGTGDLVVLAATDGVPVEIVIDGLPEGHPFRDGAGEHSPEGAPSGHAPDRAPGERAPGRVTTADLPAPPGPDCLIELPGVRLLVLDDASANRLYRLDLAGRERLVLADAPVYAEHGDLVVHPEAERVTVAVLPAPPAFTADGADLDPPRDEGPWRTWTLTAHDTGPIPLPTGLRPAAGPAPEPRRGGPMDRLSAPDDYSAAADVRLDVPDFTGADRALLRLTWTGDTGRAFIGDRLVSDHFWHGRDWDIDLTPHPQAVEHGVRLRLLPWRRATGVWVDPSVRGVPDGVTLDAAVLVRVGKVRLHAEEDPS
ncbi:beta-galactosidase [Glycomyces sp. A-F 0318]|uniref:beta-galactosidase n=1 Tax=Glycomyces amatae TaxID=2881355 RepID=UPI001E5F8194|nr:beta-galactosidase [Glycomyces amatae]MCD0444159.1 beta-galactosidase [Glycomyces amatae]